MYADLSLPFIDVDRMTPTSPDGELSMRAKFTIAFLVLFAVWLVARLNHYWLHY